MQKKKSFDKIQYFHDKNSQTKNRRELSQYRPYMKITLLTSYSVVKC